MSYCTYDSEGLYTGTSEDELPNSTLIEYPSGNGLWVFSDDDWQLVFGVDDEGKLTLDTSAIAPAPYKYISRNELYDPTKTEIVEGLSLSSEYPDLSKGTLDTLFINAQSEIEKSKLFTDFGCTKMFRDYGTYRRGDSSFLAVGITWTSEDGKVFNAKVEGGVITDFYEIFNTEPYALSEIDAATFEPIAHYINDGDTKVDVLTGEVLQDNFKTEGVNGVPKGFADDMVEKGLHFVNDIFYYAKKPYGETVEFAIVDAAEVIK